MTLRVPVDVNSGSLGDWGRKVAKSLNPVLLKLPLLQPLDEQLTSLAALDWSGNAGLAVVVNGTEDGWELVSSGGGTTTNALTINNGGAGAASGAMFNGSAAVTISYNTVGAAASSHTHAQADVTSLVSDLAAKQPLDATLTALAAYNTNGIICQTAADTFAGRTLTAPAAGITVSNGDGVAGNPTLVLANDLSALEGLGSTGLAARTAADTWAQRTITAGAGITVSNGDGVSGNPTITANGWVTLLNYDFAGGAASTKEVDVTGYKEIEVTGYQLVHAASVHRALQVSVDGGSTWFTSSGDYKLHSTAGVESNDAAIFPHGTATTAARSFVCRISNDAAIPANAECPTRNVTMTFTASATAINRIRLMGSVAAGGTPSASNFTAGTFRVRARV